MIDIKNKQDCCGCSACAQRCPKQCISMKIDDEGFLYPHVDTSNCIDCHLCEKVCPVINQGESRTPLNVYAANNPDDNIRKESSSGGIFTMLAENTIEQGGVVFGACWDDDWEVVHDYVKTKEEISKFRSSKYLQSKIGNNYKKAEQFLNEGKVVLFSGTPCQIAGLTKYLRKEYVNLLKVECVCHSVPSPGLWNRYLAQLIESQNRKKNEILAIKFRDKITGWKGYSCSIAYKDGVVSVENREKNLWMKGFLEGLYNRPSCSHCPAKGHSHADIVLGDLWGISELAPEIDDDKGMCLVISNTTKGDKVLDSIGIVKKKYFTLEQVVEKNPAVLYCVDINKKRDIFFRKYKENPNLLKLINSMTSPSLDFKIKNIIHRIYHKFK